MEAPPHGCHGYHELSIAIHRDGLYGLLEAEFSFFSPPLSLVSESDHSEANQPFLVCCMSGRTS